MNDFINKKHHFLIIILILCLALFTYLVQYVRGTFILHYHVKGLRESVVENGSKSTDQSGQRFLNHELKYVFPDSLSRSDIQQILLSKTSYYCNTEGLRLIEFPEYKLIEINDFDLLLFYFSVEGSYFKTLKLIKFLESQNYIGKLAAVHMLSKKSRQESKAILQSTVYFKILLKK